MEVDEEAFDAELLFLRREIYRCEVEPYNPEDHRLAKVPSGNLAANAEAPFDA